MALSYQILGYTIILMFLAGMVFFMYRYILAKILHVKAQGYDAIALMFFVFAFVGGCVGVVGRWFDNLIADNDTRFLVSFLILMIVVILSYTLARYLVNRKLKK